MADKGKFIVLEGIDGAGTTTQAALLDSYLKQEGHKVHLTREPSDNLIGTHIRLVLRHRYNFSSPEYLAHLFLADRIEHTNYEIEPILQKGGIVISDRFSLSSFAYQTAQGMNMDDLINMHQGIMIPDLTLFLDLSPDEALLRTKGARLTDPEMFEVGSFLERVVDNYHIAIKKLEAQGHRIVCIDGNKPIEEVRDAVRSEVSLLYQH